MAENQSILTFAKKYDKYVDTLERINVKFKGYEVYKAYKDLGDEEEMRCVGMPWFVLVKGDELRYTTTDEAFAIIDLLPDEGQQKKP